MRCSRVRLNRQSPTPEPAFATWSAQWKQEETVIQTMNEDKALHLIDYASQLLKYHKSTGQAASQSAQRGYLDYLGVAKG